MKLRSFLILFIILFFEIGLYAQPKPEIIKETLIYSIKDNDTLFLDKYGFERTNSQFKPCMIFVFGGGFYSGKRDNNNYISYYNFLVENGYSVIAIDYRLGFKNIQQQPDMGIKKFIYYFKNTISIAVEDLYDATNFVLDRAEEWNINKNMIVISGSSAGGITVLHAEYELCNRTELSKKLPSDFRYAGVISFAGAIFSTNGKLKWKNKPAPIQMFHGDADKNVPYDRIKFLKFGMYGSKDIAKQLKKIGASYYFYSEENTDHSMAVTPLHDNQEEILSFLNKYVEKKTDLQTNVNTKLVNKPKVKKRFKVKDYIKQNF